MFTIGMLNHLYNYATEAWCRPRSHHQGLRFDEFGVTPPAFAPVPAAPAVGFGFLLKILLMVFVEGIMAILANQGVAQMLRISRKGRSAFVMA